MTKINLTPLNEVVDKVWGPVGTPERDEMEARLKEEVHAYFMGKAIKDARLKQHLTQEELGNRIGVKRSQISKMESGNCSITLSTVAKVFRGLGVTTASLDLGSLGKVALW